MIYLLVLSSNLLDDPSDTSMIKVLLPLVELAQYTSIKFTETVVLEGLVASIGTIGDAYDDAAAETVMGLYESEALAKNLPFMTGPLKTLADVEELTFDWVDWYDNRRLHSSLGNMPPEEYERNYYAETNGPSEEEAANNTAA